MSLLRSIVAARRAHLHRVKDRQRIARAVSLESIIQREPDAATRALLRFVNRQLAEAK